jgi:radical SAM superfamily enzyme YgiQ (UPF0313 family)
VSGESDHPNTVKLILEKALTKNKIPEIIQPKITMGELNWVIPPIRKWDNKYHAWLKNRNGNEHKTSTLFTSRGCVKSCIFCSSGRNGTIWNKFIRYEPVEVVESQIREIVENGHSGLMYYDDILPLNKPRTLEILKLHKKYNVIYRCFLRTDFIIKQGGFEYLQEMANAGLVEVLAGVESADNEIKKNIEKGTTIEQDTMVLNWCKQLGIKFKASLILGLPGENRLSMEKTRDWILENRPDRVDINTLIPFPGTPLTTNPEKYDVYWKEEMPEEWFFKGPEMGVTSLVGTSNLSPEEIKEFHDNLIKEVRSSGISY